MAVCAWPSLSMALNIIAYYVCRFTSELRIDSSLSLNSLLFKLKVEGGEGTTTFDVRLPKGNDDVHPVVGDVLYVKLFWHESGSDYRAEDIWTGTMYSEEAVVPKLENVPEYFQPGQPISYLVSSSSVLDGVWYNNARFCTLACKPEIKDGGNWSQEFATSIK